MKKNIVAGLTILLSTTLTNAAFAQNSYNKNPILPALNNSFESNALKVVTNEKAEKTFVHTFKNATDIRWSSLNNGGSVVAFISEGSPGRMFYNKHGHCTGILRYYTEDKMPKDIREMVKSAYYNYNIFLATEITVGYKKAYEVKIEDKTSWKTIMVMDGEMNVIEELEKA